ncbi:unnamed protein product [Discosporangium mesarthrocarpum]
MDAHATSPPVSAPSTTAPVGEEGRVRARNAEVLAELDAAELKVAEMLEVAAETLENLAEVDSVDQDRVEACGRRFLGLVGEVHHTLSSHSCFIQDYTPHKSSRSGATLPVTSCPAYHAWTPC